MEITTEHIEWLHCLVQELEDNDVKLPMGDYGDVYNILESARERFEAPRLVRTEPTRLERAAACLRSATKALTTDRTFAAEALIAQAAQHIHTHNAEIIDAKA